MDGVNRYDCVCNKGYWGTNCEKKIKNEEGKVAAILDDSHTRLPEEWR